MLAERLKLVRQAKGLTLEELSEATNRAITKQAISKYEKGLDIPSPRVLLALSNALGVESSTLVNEPKNTIEIGHYRKKAGLTKSEQERLESYLSFQLEQCLYVRNLLYPGAQFDLPIRKLRANDPDDVESHASDLRKQWGIGMDPIRNVVDLLEERGISVCFTDADGKFDGLSAVGRSLGRKWIGAAVLCRSGLTRERQRLNLAHELAHLVLLPRTEELEEDFAWRFAGAFLAPEKTLRDDVGRFRKLIGFEEMLILKRRYGMSIQALLMRFKALGILSNESHRQAFMQMSRLGYRQHEPDDTYPAETPRWFRGAVLRAVSEGLMTAPRATELLGAKVEVPAGRVSLVRLIASLPVEERQPFLAAAVAEQGPEAEYDQDWVDMDEDYAD